MTMQFRGPGSLLLASTFLATPLWAATIPKTSSVRGNILEQIVVTAARRRTENVQKTPIAVTALNAATLARAHVNTYADLGNLTPNVQISKQFGNFDTVTVYMRGFGAQTTDPAVDPHVALFLDGVYQPALSGTLLDFFDIGSVEVLGGPQGTLFGKNAPVGAVAITSAKPTGEWGGAAEADYGSFHRVGARFKINAPILKDSVGQTLLAGKFTFVEKEGGNWVYNLANDKRDEGGENSKSMRISLALTPGENFRWDLTSALLLNRDPQSAVRSANYYGGQSGTPSSATQSAPLMCLPAPIGFGPGYCQPTKYGTTDSDYTDHNWANTVDVASTMAYNLAPVSLTAVTGYIAYDSKLNNNITGTNTNALNAYGDQLRYNQESQEFRISSRKGGGADLGGRLDWVLGGFYSNYHYDATENLSILDHEPGANIFERQDGRDASEAVFLHAIYNLTKKWTVTFGMRQSWDQKDHSYTPAGFTGTYLDSPASFTNTSFETGTAYQIDDNRMVYFRFAQGYEQGGFTGFPGGPGLGGSFQPETNNAYEVGLKSDWFNKHLRANIDLFLNKISNLQVEGTVPADTPTHFLQETTNAGAATVEGIEGQITAVPLDNLTTHANFGYLDTKYDRYVGTVCSNITGVSVDCSGLPFAFAPKWTIDFGADYVMDLPKGLGTAVLSSDYNYKSSLYTSDPPFPAGKQGGYGLLNASLKFTDESEKYSLEFYGSNILNRQYKVQINDASISLGVDDGRPAEWGVRAIAKF